MKDDQGDRFGPGQEAPQRVRVAPGRVAGAFAVRQAVAQGVLALPGPVGLDRRAVEVAGPEFVEARFDQDRYAPAVQGDADRFLGALEAGADSEVDVHAGELRAEGARLRSPSFGQRDGAGGVAAERVCGVRRRLCVPGEDKQPGYLSRHRRPPSPRGPGTRATGGARRRRPAPLSAPVPSFFACQPRAGQGEQASPDSRDPDRAGCSPDGGTCGYLGRRPPSPRLPASGTSRSTRPERTGRGRPTGRRRAPASSTRPVASAPARSRGWPFHAVPVIEWSPSLIPPRYLVASSCAAGVYRGMVHGPGGGWGSSCCWMWFAGSGTVPGQEG